MVRTRSMVFRLSLLTTMLLFSGFLVAVLSLVADLSLWVRLSLLSSMTVFLCAAAVAGIYRLLRPFSAYIYLLARDRVAADAFDVESCEEMEQLKSTIRKHDDAAGRVVESLRVELNILQSQAVRLGDGYALLKNKLQEALEYQRTQGVQINSMIGGLVDSEKVSKTLLSSYEALSSNVAISTGDIENATRIFDEVRGAQLNRVARLSQLMRDFEEIDEAIRRIHLISDQTKIVAFNAGIEASASGDLGRRFGVVASDIRSLAQNVERINRDIRRIVDNLTEGLTEIAKRASDDAQRVEKVLDRIRLVSSGLTKASLSPTTLFTPPQVPIETLQSFWHVHREEYARHYQDLSGLSEHFSTQLEEFENRLNQFTYQVNGIVL